jgi:excisionase family DNA binding protein
MAEEKLLTVRDVSIILGVSEKEVMDLAENGTIPGYKVGGVYLRFKKDQVQEYKRTMKPSLPKADISQKYSLEDKINDFLYFNDFYILASLVIILLLVIIFRGQ